MEVKKVKVLLIEDNPDDVELIRRKLARSANAKLSITSVTRLNDGLEHLTRNKTDLILSDLGLPDSHGLDTVTKILLSVPHIPLVVLSGFDDEAIAIKAVQSGAQDYIVKGQLEGAQIERSLFYAIERARLQMELEQYTQEISKVQANLHKILEKNTDAIIVVSGDRKILFANPAAEFILGHKKRELLNKPFDFPLDAGKTSEIEIMLRNEEKIIAEINTVEIDWESKPAYLASMRNITERKRDEDALRESEEKFSKAFQHSPEVIVISSIEDGTIFEANDTFMRLTGYAREEVIGRKSSEVGTWAIPEERAEMLKTLKEKGIVGNKEFHFRMKSGQIRTWLFSAEIIQISNNTCMLSVTTDITERKKVEEALRFSDTALKSIHEGVFAMDNDFIITRWNEMCEKMFGIKAFEAIGKSAADVITMVEEYPKQNEERINLLLSQGFNKEEQIYRTPRGDVWVDVHAQAIEENGKRHGWVTLVSDITDRKKTEETLRFSDAAFKSIHESVIATDIKYVITHWNQISEQIYGIKASAVIGKKLLDVIEIVETRPGENDRRFQMLEAKGYYQEEQLHRTRQGEIWVDVRVQAIEDNGERYGWVVLGTAITQRKLAEEALKRSEEKYRELISTSFDGIVSTDSQMRIIIWNRGAERIFGYKAQEMLGQSLMKIVSDRYKKEKGKGFTKYLINGKGPLIGKVVEVSGIKKDGSEVPIELSISTRKTDETYIATAIIRDISIRKEAEERIRKQNEFLNNILESITLPFYVVDANDYTIIMANSATHAGDLSKKPTCYAITHKRSKPCSGIDDICPLKTIKETKKPVVVEHIHYNENGNSRNVEVHGYPLFDAKGDVIQMIESCLDITERKQMEEKLRKIDQMKSEFLSNVSHELRTPLQSISGFTKLIMNGQVPDPATQQEFFQIIDRETMHLGNLINGLLDMSRLESGRFQIYRKLIPIRDTIIDSVKMFHTLAHEKNITLSDDIPLQLPEMEVDNERMRQVIINLLSNAIKFSDPGGSVNVKVEKRESELLFQVSDHGTGIRQEAMQHLFERFYRAEGEMVRGGTGLGLYISKQIIEAHGGHIWAESKFGEGSTFSFTLPLDGKGGNYNGKENSGHRRRPGDIETGRLLPQT